MGYYTNFVITAFTDEGPLDYDALRSHFDEDFFYDEFSDDHSIHTYSKWYDYESDMHDVSTANPDVTYRVYGVGEESGDEWVTFFKNGQMEEHYREEWDAPKVPERI